MGASRTGPAPPGRPARRKVFFEQLTIRGEAGSLVWVYHPAAELRGWTIRQLGATGWSLVAGIGRIDSLRVRQRPLFFHAHRRGGGEWRFPVLAITLGSDTLSAALGQPE